MAEPVEGKPSQLVGWDPYRLERIRAFNLMRFCRCCANTTLHTVDFDGDMRCLVCGR